MTSIDAGAAPRKPWYKYGVAFLMFEIALAIAVRRLFAVHDVQRPRRFSGQALTRDRLKPSRCT